MTGWARLGGLLAVLAALSVCPVRAEEARFEGAVFEQPEGWTRINADKPAAPFSLQRRFGPGRGSALIEVLRPVAMPDGAFDATFAKLVVIVPELARESPFIHGSGTTANGHRFAYDYRCCAERNGMLLGATTVAVGERNRIHALLLVSVDLHGDDSRDADRAFAALVRSFRPTEADAAFALAPPAGAGGLDGVFTHLATGLRPSVFGGVSFYSESEVMMFDPGGLYSRAIPGGGEDVAAHCRAAPTDCGTYRLHGAGLLHGPDRIELRSVSSRFAVIKTEDKAFARVGEDLRIGDADQRRIPPLPRGTPFEGTWRALSGSAGSTATSSGSVTVERVLTLGRDGRFRRTGFVGMSSTTGNGGVTVGRTRPGEAGRYEVEGYHLVLTGDDGRRETLSLFMPDRGSDELLIIDGGNYLKRKPGG